MGKRGPKPQSESHLNVVVASGERPRPLFGMSDRARNLWVKIVDSLPPAHFRPCSLPILRAYCEAEAVHFEACQAIKKTGLFVKAAGSTEENPSMKANPAIAIQTAKSSEMAMLSAKLRLSVNSYTDRQKEAPDEKPKSARKGLMFGGRDSQ